MSYGLRCWDSKGNITLDITDRISRVTQYITIPANSNSGTINVGNIAGSFWLYQEDISGRNSYLTFQKNGSVLSWVRNFVDDGYPKEARQVNLIVGYY